MQKWSDAYNTEGNEQIVKMLLNNRVDVNGQGGKYSNALQSALAAGE